MGQKPDEGDIGQEVRRLVHKWDPCGFLASGAPDDEWDSEVAMILARVPAIRSPLDAAKVLSEMFTSQLGVLYTVQNCSSWGDELFRALARLGMVDGAPEEA